MAFRFQTRIRHVSISWSPFSAEQMSSIGTVWIDTKLARIRSAIDSTDAPAKPLSPRYRDDKVAGRRVTGSGGQKYRGLGVRDWKLRGWTLGSAKVKVASEDRVTIGLISAQSNQIISAQRRLCEMWIPSPKEMDVVRAAVRASLRQHTSRILRSAFGRKSA